MADVLVTGIKIGDMPLKGTVSGNEKLPTGDVGDLAVTPNQIKDFTIQEGNLVNQEQLDDAIESVEQTSSGLAGRVQTLENKTSNINNTADLDKPISNATQAALNAKADKVDVDAKLDLKADKDKVVSSFNGQTGAVTLDQSDLVDVGGNFTATPIFQNVPKLTKPDGSSIPEIDSQIQPLVNSLAVHRQGLTPTFDQAYSTSIGGYPLNARLMLDNGDIVRSTVANNTANPNVDMTGWVKINSAGQIIDSSGSTQQKINDFVKCVEVSPELFGYESGDATQAFIDAALYAKTNNVPFVAKNPNGYLITSSLDFYTDTKISKVIMPADGVYRYLSVKSQKVPTTVDISTLAGLDVFSNKVIGFPLSAVGKYIKITSEDVLTERNNAPSNTPYTKNTAFHLLDSAGTISPSLDMGFSEGTTAQVYIMPTESRINFEIGEIVSVGTGLNHNSIGIERDSVDVSIGNVSASSGFRTLVSLTGNDCTFYSPVIKDAQYSGYGYGISIGLCCDTKIFGMKGSNCTTSLDGRHGANVVVQDAKIDIAGSHWGNNYIFKNCDIGIVTWAGKDLKLDGGSLKDYVSMRVDVAMSIGTCEIVGTKLNSSSWVITPSSTIIADFFTSPRKVFDSVIVRDVECTDNLGGIFGFGALTVFSGDYIPPQNFLFENIKAPNADRLRLAYLNLANSLALTKPAIFRAKNIQAKNVTPFMARGFSKYPSPHGYEVRAVDCGKVFIQCDANTFSLYKLGDSTLVGANRINASTALGDMIFDDCVIEHDSTLATNGLFYIESRKGFTVCEYRGLFNNGGAVNGATMYSIGARAANGASGFPVPLTNYINRTLYQTDELSFAFDPPSIAANSMTSTTVTVAGARVGDFVSATFSIYNAGIDVLASVSATNTVTVTFKNTTSAPIDLPAGSIRVKMI